MINWRLCSDGLPPDDTKVLWRSGSWMMSGYVDRHYRDYFRTSSNDGIFSEYGVTPNMWCPLSEFIE